MTGARKSIVIAIGLFILILNINCSYKHIVQWPDKKYKVIGIDSVNNYYLIYLIKNDSTFKVVSHKPLIEERCNTIRIGISYPFLLKSSLSEIPSSLKNISPKYNLHINCLAYDDSTSICVEDGMVRDLFYAENIKGLCFLGNR